MRRRIFLVEGKAGLSPAVCQKHWRTHHAALYARTAGLRGYVQRRPLSEQWGQLRWQACAETWFDDREAEKAALSSAHYESVIAPDEARFLNRSAAWTSNVIGHELLGPTKAFDILFFGGANQTDATPSVILRLDRDTPVPGSREIVVVSTEDRSEAIALATGSSTLAIAVETVAIVEPPLESQ